MKLEIVEGRWAGAWVRVRRGEPPFVTRAPKAADARDATMRARSPREIVGVGEKATLAEIKAAFRERATVVHPDQGGDATAFMELMKAYETLVARARRPRKRT